MNLEDPTPQPQYGEPYSRNPFRSQGASVPSDPEPRDQSGYSNNTFSNLQHAVFRGENSFVNARDIYPTTIYTNHPAAQPVISIPNAGTAQSTMNNSPPRNSLDTVPSHDSEIYARLLFPKKLGWPLWHPQPLKNLPMACKQRGVSIGDIGIITADGEFDFFFNIMHAADNPVNRNDVPEKFEHLNHPENPEDISYDPEAWFPGDHISTTSIQPLPIRAEDSLNRYHHFTAAGPSGAVLVLPKGGSRENLLNLEPYCAYAKRNAMHWYKHINCKKGRQAANGTVYLVTGVDKTEVWGNGAYSNLPPEHNLNTITFREAMPDGFESRFSYVWTRSHSVSTRSGPAKENRDENINLPNNQCIFLRGFRVALSEGLWGSMFGAVEVSPVQDSSVETILQKSHNIPFSNMKSFSLVNMLGCALSGFGRTVAQSRSRSLGRDWDEAVTLIPNQAPAADLHPSDALNRYLLAQIPSAEVAITHDDVWCSVLDEDSTDMPASDDMISRVLEKYSICYHQGSVTFQMSEDLSGVTQSTIPISRPWSEDISTMSVASEGSFWTSTPGTSTPVSQGKSTRDFESLHKKLARQANCASTRKPYLNGGGFVSIAGSDYLLVPLCHRGSRQGFPLEASEGRQTSPTKSLPSFGSDRLSEETVAPQGPMTPIEPPPAYSPRVLDDGFSGNFEVGHFPEPPATALPPTARKTTGFSGKLPKPVDGFSGSRATSKFLRNATNYAKLTDPSHFSGGGCTEVWTELVIDT